MHTTKNQKIVERKNFVCILIWVIHVYIHMYIWRCKMNGVDSWLYCTSKMCSLNGKLGLFQQVFCWLDGWHWCCSFLFLFVSFIVGASCLRTQPHKIKFMFMFMFIYMLWLVFVALSNEHSRMKMRIQKLTFKSMPWNQIPERTQHASICSVNRDMNLYLIVNFYDVFYSNP